MGFSSLIGNKRVKKILSSYISGQKIPPSMIFYGPKSADINSYAIAFSKAVSCLEKSVEGDYCDRCENCIEISKGIFPDVNIIYPSGMYYKKEQILYLIEDNSKRPMKSERKIYIISDAARMNENSSNSFLKVLEEPSPSTIFILLTNNYDILLSTIKSRCQLIRFYHPSKKELQIYFKRIGFDNEKAELLASISQSEKSNIEVDDFYSFLENRMEKFSVLEKLIKKEKNEEVLIHLFKMSNNRNNFILYFRELINLISLFIRDIIIIKIGSKNDLIINTDFLKKLKELEGYITIEKLMYLIIGMELTLRDISRNLNSKVLIQEFFNYYK